MVNGPISLALKMCRSSNQLSVLSAAEIKQMLQQVPGWTYRDGVISKTFSFADYAQTMAFASATAWISHRQDHHPDLHVGYNSCRIDYCTHAVAGISENDFICAAKIDALFGL
jgi:4a-hydroxytetrahydrobiopterin dehydratase